MNNKFNIEKFLSLEGYDTDTRVSRRKNSEVNSQEFFTPYSIVKRMCDKIPPEDWGHPLKTFCEPCFGNGQFILFILYRRIIEYNINWKTALETLFGVELMEDNVEETKCRVVDLFKQLGLNFDEVQAREIMNRNFICHDFFTWNFEEWREYIQEELKEINKKKK